ncbi:MAG: LysR substrate-binding domain-containing protein [Duganella sp.]
MNFQQLRTIRDLTRLNYSLSALAAVSKTSPPGINRQIRDLEGEIGVPIFARRSKRIMGLSEPGKTIVRLVDRLLQEADQLQRANSEYATSSHGTLTVAATHAQARYALPPVVPAFRAAFPDVRLAFKQCSPEHIGKWVANGSADIGIATEGLDDVPELVAFPCYRWSHLALVPQGHPLLVRATDNTLTLADLAQFPLITYDHSYTGRRHLDGAFSKAGLRPNVVLTAMDSDVIKQYVELGMGVGLVASIAFDPAIDTGLRAVDVGQLLAARTTWLAVRRGAHLRSYLYAFIAGFAPHLTREVIDRALEGPWPQDAAAARAESKRLMASLDFLRDPAAPGLDIIRRRTA